MALIFLFNIVDMVYIGSVLLEPFKFSALLKLFIVVIVVPITTNAYTFYVYDQVLKKKLHHRVDDSVVEENFFTFSESITSNVESDLVY